MKVTVNYHNHTVTHSLHTSPGNWDRIQNFVEWANGYLESGRQEFGLESDMCRNQAYEFDGCTVPTAADRYESYFIHNVKLIPFESETPKVDSAVIALRQIGRHYNPAAAQYNL